MLYLVPTPIGNLKDITLRALEVLNSCEYILCEDTRRSSILLNHYNIKKNLKSYHLFNEAKKLQEIVGDLESGQDIAIISDGGTPGICDPGAKLIKTCREKQIPITALPGACAVTTAFSLFGSEESRFQFLGFFPRKGKEINQFLLQLLYYDGASIFYESPQRITATLEIFEQVAPNRSILIARELTKSHEEHLYGNPRKLLDHFDRSLPRGEFVVIVDKEEIDPFAGLSTTELLDLLQQNFKLSLTDAIKTAAHILNKPKQLIYKWVHERSDSEETEDF